MYYIEVLYIALAEVWNKTDSPYFAQENFYLMAVKRHTFK